VINTIRIPPQSLDAERSVLGSMLLLNEAIDDIDLRPDEFYRDEHQAAFTVVRDMWRDGRRSIDVVTLAEELRRRDQFDSIGGAVFLAELMDTVPHAAHVRHYAKLVRQKAQQRNLIYACTDAIEKAYCGESDEVSQNSTQAC